MDGFKPPFLPPWIRNGLTVQPGNGSGGRVFMPSWARTGTAIQAGSATPERSFLPVWARQPQERLPADSSDARPIGEQTLADRLKPGNEAAHGVPGAQRQQQVKPLLVRGGTCVIPGHGLLKLDLLLKDGRISSIGAGLPGDGAETIDATGCHVLPGLIDPHVHLGIFAPFEEEIRTETRSALLNGVTTIGLYAGGTEPYLRTLDHTIRLIRECSWVDVFIHLPIFTPEQLEEIPIYASRYGITSFKAYMCGIPGIIPAADDGFLLDIMTAVAALGPGAVLNIHAENASLVERAAAAGLAARPAGLDPARWANARPSYVEEEAVRRAAFLARTTGTRIYFVHLSSAVAAATVRTLKQEGADILAETTSPYLTLEPGAGGDSRTMMVPPVRGGADRAALWQALADGTIDTVGTDHTPLTAMQKQLRLPAPQALPGYPAVGTHLPALYDESMRRGFDIAELSDRTAAAPARIFGLGGRKGALIPGYDADIVLVDPRHSETCTALLAASRADFALHEGEQLVGWPKLVIKGGVPVNRVAISAAVGAAVGAAKGAAFGATGGSLGSGAAVGAGSASSQADGQPAANYLPRRGRG